MNKKNLLFITWDGPQTSYMEGLFMPIFNEISKHESISFHVIQFTWGTKKRTQITSEFAENLGIKYTALPITRKPVAFVGSLFTMVKGVSFIKKYIFENTIDIVMPRSTMPAIMVNRIKNKSIKIIFDADGLPLEERVDFAGLSRKSKQFKWFKSEETKMLIKAEGVITRSHHSIDFHLNTIGTTYKNKFDVVFNGRNAEFFKPNQEEKSLKRKELGISENDKVFVYCGSLGPQYGWKEMTQIFSEYLKNHSKAKFLILTGSPSFAEDNMPKSITNNAIIKSVPFDEVPKYLNVADVAFAIREPKISMQGVAPIKLGEYLLMNLPTIASAGIGDSEEILSEIPNCLLFHHDNPEMINQSNQFVENLKNAKIEDIRKYGLTYFSIEKSAESYIKALKKVI